MINHEISTVSVESSYYQYLQQINRIPSLSQDEEFLLSKAYLESNNLEAAHKLVSSHLKLVAKIAMRYKNYGLPMLEVISEGNLGLMQAVKKYNPDLGFRLSTYAMWWIKASIQEYVLRSWSLVKIGTTAAQKKLFFSLGKIKRKITALYSRSVNEQDFQQIADELGVTTKEVSEMNIRLAGSDISLNQPVNNNQENKVQRVDLLPENRPTHDLVLIKKQESASKSALLKSALQILNSRELQILTKRKLQDSPETLESLSNEYNISKERVRQIENKAFEKIQSFILRSDKASEIALR